MNSDSDRARASLQGGKGPTLVLTVFLFLISEVVAQWCTQGDLLAVAGMERPTQLGDLPNGPLLKSAMVKFYNVRGEHIFTLDTLVQVRMCARHPAVPLMC